MIYSLFWLVLSNLFYITEFWGKKSIGKGESFSQICGGVILKIISLESCFAVY